jgi:hypothetical protein
MSLPQEKEPPLLIGQRLGGPQNWSGRCGEEKYLPPAGNPTPSVQPVARRDATDTGMLRIPVVSRPHAATAIPPEKEPPVLIG